MKKNKIFSLLGFIVLFVTSCDDELLEPSPDNRQDESQIYSNPSFAEGILLNGYKNLDNGYSFDEVATDDAVTNDKNSNLRRMVLGEWSSQFSPVSSWNSSYENIFYMNYFLSFVDSVQWYKRSAERNELFKKRFKGEALALRAWYYFDLLKKHGGVDKEGNLSGFVLLDKHTEPEDWDKNLPRNNYEDCVNFILSDCDAALALLPLEYGEVDEPDYDQVFGSMNEQRVNGIFVKALKSRILIHIASPAFNLDNDDSKWEFAAVSAAELLSEVNGINGLADDGISWYLDKNSPEIIWRGNANVSSRWEENNFPPSLFGNGEVNPTQNLVNAFPMGNGYPINSLESGYDEANPYENRDPRLSKYIIYNGGNIGVDTIHTDVHEAQDGLNNTPQSTRTGYYLKKLMNDKVKLTPGSVNEQIHFYTHFRYTEIFLNYAEAANEAWGPDADPKAFGYTARDIIGLIRERAGIDQPDKYLESLTSKKQMRELIHNERRLELCFEGFRFWDLRRWERNLSESARGITIDGNELNIIDVEARNYQPFMKYGPIPYQETLINKELIQNTGW